MWITLLRTMGSCRSIKVKRGPVGLTEASPGLADGMVGRKWLKFAQLDEGFVGQPVVFRARLHNMRPQGALQVRERRYTADRAWT